MRCRLADNLKELSHKAEAVSSGVEERVYINGDLNLFTGQCLGSKNQVITQNIPHLAILWF